MNYFETLLQISAVCAGMIILTMLLSRVMGHRLAARYKRWIWLVLALRLLIPVNFSLPQAPITVAVPDLRTPVYSMPQTRPTVPASDRTPVQYENESLAPVQASESQTRSPLEIAFALWAIGVLCMGAYEAAGYFHARRKLLRWSKPAEPEIYEPLREIRGQMRIHREIPVYRCRIAPSPMLIGLLRPSILLPDEPYTREELALVLRHELTHCKRSDIAYKFVILLARIVHWFNPLVYFMYRQADIDMEFACDEAVLRGIGTEQKRLYGETILSAACSGRETRVALSTHFHSGKKHLARRIRNIMYAKSRKYGACVAAIALCLILAGGTIVGFTASGYAETAFEPAPYISEQFGPLLALRFDGYRDLTLTQFRGKVFDAMAKDEATYLELIDRYDETALSMRYSDDGASFIYNTLIPLTAEKWESWRYAHYVKVSGGDIVPVEYVLTREVLSADTATVGQVEDKIAGIMNEIQDLVLGNAADGSYDRAAIQDGLRRLESQYSDGAIRITIEEHIPDASRETRTESELSPVAREETVNPATQADYDLLLSLMEPGFEKWSVERFNDMIQTAFQEEEAPVHASFERVRGDILRGEKPGTLTDAEYRFIASTLVTTIDEYASAHKSLYSDEPVYPTMNIALTEYAAVIEYHIEHEVLDAASLTVGERDDRLQAVLNGMEHYLAMREADEWAHGEATMTEHLRVLCEAHSDEKLRIAPAKVYYRYEEPDQESESERAYRLLEVLSEIDTSLPLAEYKERITEMCAEYGMSLFEAMSSAKPVYNPEDPLYPFVTGSLTYTSQEIFAAMRINPDERAFAQGSAQRTKYQTEAEFEAENRGGMSDEEWAEVMKEMEGDFPFVVSHVSVPYFIYYDIEDEQKVTVDERDDVIAAVISDLQRYLDRLRDDELYADGFAAGFSARLNEAASQFSTADIALKGEIGATDEIIAESIVSSPNFDYHFAPNPDTYEKYRPFGIAISEDGARLLYDGQRVRLFADEHSDTEAFYLDEDGALDLSVVRNSSGEITSIEQISEEQAEELRSAFFSDDLRGQNKFDRYLPYGITVSADQNIIYHDGQRVRLLVDQRSDHSYDSFWFDEDGTINLLVERNASDEITGIERITEAQAQGFLSSLSEYERNAVASALKEVEERFGD